MSNRRFSVVASAISDDLRQAARGAGRAGFAGLVFQSGASTNLTELTASGRRELRHVLSSERQELVALRGDLDPQGLGAGADVERVLTRLDRVLETAAGLGARCVCIDLGPLPPAPVVPEAKPAITPEQAGLILLPAATPAAPVAPVAPAPPADERVVAQVHSALAELCARADRYRIPVALSSSLSSFASLHHTMRAIDCPWFGVESDPAGILGDAWDLDEVFSTFGPQLRHVRARDAVLGADRRTRPAVIGQGSVDWRRLMSALDEAAYTGMITIDPTELPDRANAAVAGRIHLQSL